MWEPYDPQKKIKELEEEKTKQKEIEKQRAMWEKQKKQWEQLQQSKEQSIKRQQESKEKRRIDWQLKEVKKSKGKKKKTFNWRLNNWQKPTKKQTRKKRRSLEKKLWKIFSKYIRKRDCLRTTGTENKCICITCGKTIEDNGSDLHWGHFISRKYKAVKFNEHNVHWQCNYCNTYQDGEQYIYWLAVDILYWDWTAEKLKNQKRDIKKYTIEELEDKIKYYKKAYQEISIEDIEIDRVKKYRNIGKMIYNIDNIKNVK